MEFGKGCPNGVAHKECGGPGKMDKVDVLIVDKTGTITEGSLLLKKKVECLLEDSLREEVPSIQRFTQCLSEHPTCEAQ